MATYPPPNFTEPLSVFNPANWETFETTLTTAEGDKRYLKFPVAQGLETLQSIIVNGTADFNDDIIQNGVNSNISQDNTSNSTPNTLRPTDVYGDLNLRKPTSTTGGAMRLWDITALSGNSSQIYNTGTQMALVNLNNSGAITMNTRDGAGASVQTLQIYATNTNSTKPINMTGTTNTDRIINNVYYQLQDANSLVTTTGQIYAGSGVFNYDNDINGGSHNFATNTSGGVQTIPLTFNSVDMTIGTTNPPTCSASSVIALSDDSAKLPSTAWVRDYVASIPPPVVTQYTYTQQFTGSLGNYNVPIPTGCVKFDIKVIGTGGLAGVSNAQPPSGGEPEYTLVQSGTGGGAGVAYKEGIPIVKQGTNFTNSLTYINYGAGLSTQVELNNENLCQVFPGGNGNVSVAGAGCTTPPVVNTNWGNWVYWNGNAGQAGPFVTYSSPPDAGQVGGGNKYGGVCGNPIITNSSQGSRNVPGSGQIWGALSGPSYGFPSYNASPINYGGIIVTWYIQS